MAINREYIGRSYPPGEPYEVSRVKIREFADAIGDPNPLYRDRAAAQAAGHRDVLAPPTFPIVIAMRATRQVVDDPDLGVDYSMVVHGEQGFTYQRPLYAGDLVTARVMIDDIRAAGRNELLTTRTEITAVTGEPVCTAISTIVVRGAAQG